MGSKVRSGAAPLHTASLHSASGPQMLACTREGPVHLLLPFEARSGADSPALHTVLCRPILSRRLLTFSPSASQDAENLSMLPSWSPDPSHHLQVSSQHPPPLTCSSTTPCGQGVSSLF